VNTSLLVINTVTNITTFLMIFLIRDAQNRESEAVQIKLDELIRVTETAQNTLSNMPVAPPDFPACSQR
jgi:low affinity Fe/Cu permease